MLARWAIWDAHRVWITWVLATSDMVSRYDINTRTSSESEHSINLIHSSSNPSPFNFSGPWWNYLAGVARCLMIRPMRHAWSGRAWSGRAWWGRAWSGRAWWGLARCGFDRWGHAEWWCKRWEHAWWGFNRCEHAWWWCKRWEHAWWKCNQPKFHLDSAQNFIFIQSEIPSLSARNFIFISPKFHLYQPDKHLSHLIFSSPNSWHRGVMSHARVWVEWSLLAEM